MTAVTMRLMSCRSHAGALSALIGAILILLAASGAAQEPLRVGDPLPALKGRFLTGRDAVLPQVSSGQVALMAIGFTYKSRVPVEEWAEWSRMTIGSKTGVRFFEVPMIGGLGTLARLVDP